MDPQDVIIAMILVEMKREETRRMKELLRARRVALREKAKERAMLKRKKQHMLEKQVAKRKLVDEYSMVFIEAIEKNDMENVPRNFDEKAMMNTILTIMNSDDGGHSGDNGRFAADYGDTILKTGLVLEEKPTADVIVAEKNSDDSCERNNGGFAGDNGGINNAAPETSQNIGEEATMAVIKGTKSGGSTDGGDAGGYCGSRK